MVVLPGPTDNEFAWCDISNFKVSLGFFLSIKDRLISCHADCCLEKMKHEYIYEVTGNREKKKQV